MRKFCVAVDDQGQLMVGEEPQGEEEGEMQGGGGSIQSLVGGEDEASEGYLQPVENEAAAMAAVQQFIATAGGGPNAKMETERMGEEAFAGGFKGEGM